MRKIWYLAVIGALALTAACETGIDIPETIPENPVPTAAVFTASTEGAVTKTALDASLNVLWQSGDAITIVDGANHVGVYSTTSTTTKGEFAHSSGDVADTPSYTAYYPAAIYSGGTLTFPAEQTYVAGNISGAPMMAVSSTTSLGFKNLGGIIRLNLTTNQAEKKVRSISLSATQGMSGTFTVTNDAAVVSGSAGVTLDCGSEGVAIGTDAVPFHIAVPANTYTGLSITVTTTTGAYQTFTLKSDKIVEVGRSQIATINLSTNNFHSVYDLTADNVTVPTGETATVTGNSDAHTLTIGAGASVTLQNTTSRQIITEGDATLTLVGDNVIAPVTIDRFNAIIPANNSTLTINGSGSLDCTRWSTGTSNACINNNTINLIVESGNLTMTSSKYRGATAVTVNNYTQTGGTMTIDVGSTNNDGDRYPAGLSAANDILISGGSISSMGSVAIYAGHDMEISGGTVVATSNGGRNYYGNSGLSAVGTLTIRGGTVTASGEGGGVTGPGIGSVDSCGDIIITGGNITATGFNDYGSGGSSGIGTGSASSGSCGTITITSGIERLVVTKASSAQAPIGKGNASSSVGTITIDGVENPTAESFFTGLSLAVSNGGNTWTLTPASNTPASLANLKDMVNADKDCSAYIGRYVYSDGSIGTSETDAIGLVAYTSRTATQLTGINESCRVLVLGLTDISTSADFGTAWDYCNALSLAIAGVEWSNWRIPTTGQWNVICQSDGLGQGSFANLSGDTSQAKLRRDVVYWTASIHHTDTSDYGWPWTIGYADPGNDANLAYVNWNWARSDYQRAARACFGY